MYMRTSYGLVWVSEEPPYFHDWQGRQLYKFHVAEPSRRQRPTLPLATYTTDPRLDSSDRSRELH